MPLNALLLALAAAAMHAGWNFILKGINEKHIFAWWTLVIGSLIYFPLLASHMPVPAGIWPYAVSSALVEAIYYFSLIRAYEHDDFSLVYPIARGAAPALLAVWAVVFLGEYPRPTGIAGLLLLLFGLMVVSGGLRLFRRAPGGFGSSGVLAALSISLFISIYSAIDGAAVKLMAPAAYTVLVLSLTGIFIAPVVFVRYGYKPVISVGLAHWGRILVVAILMILTYILVLTAYTMARVSYVAALRELSVVLAALGGWLWLGEEFGIIRTAGAVLIFCGILVIALAG